MYIYRPYIKENLLPTIDFQRRALITVRVFITVSWLKPVFATCFTASGARWLKKNEGPWKREVSSPFRIHQSGRGISTYISMGLVYLPM